MIMLVAYPWKFASMDSKVFLAELIIKPKTSDVITTKMLATRRITELVSSSLWWDASFGYHCIMRSEAATRHPKMASAIQREFIHQGPDQFESSLEG
jgi:hypothetical protein